MEYDYLYKVILLGDSGVGKSNLRTRLCYNEFSENTRSTIGTEFSHKKFPVQNKIIKIQVWDTFFQRSHTSEMFNMAYFRGALGAVVVYDICNKSSFTNITQWLKKIKAYIPRNICILMIGNKVDLLDQREVLISEAEAFASEYKLLFRETSALNTSNVADAFQELVNEIYRCSDDPMFQFERPPSHPLV